MGILTSFCIFWYTIARRGKFGVEALWDASVCASPVRTEHRTGVLNWALSQMFSVWMFKLRFVFVRSGAGGSEGELGSVLLFVKRGSLRVHRTRRASTQLSFSASFVWIALNSFEYFFKFLWQPHHLNVYIYKKKKMNWSRNTIM